MLKKLLVFCIFTFGAYLFLFHGSKAAYANPMGISYTCSSPTTVNAYVFWGANPDELGLWADINGDGTFERTYGVAYPAGDFTVPSLPSDTWISFALIGPGFALLDSAGAWSPHCATKNARVDVVFRNTGSKVSINFTVDWLKDRSGTGPNLLTQTITVSPGSLGTMSATDPIDTPDYVVSWHASSAFTTNCFDPPEQASSFDYNTPGTTFYLLDRSVYCDTATNLSSGVPRCTSATTVDVDFSWNPASGDSLDAQYHDWNTTGSDPWNGWSVGVGTGSVTRTNIPHRSTIYWRVNTHSATGYWYPSQVRSFTTPDCTPPPVPASLSVSKPACSDSAYNATLSWTNSGSGWFVDLTSDASFSGFSNKDVSGTTSTSAPSGFNPALALNPAITYYWRIFYGVAGTWVYGSAFSVPTCTSGQPTVDIKANSSGQPPSDGPITVTSGSSVTISWTTVNSPTSCTASGAWSGSPLPAGGSQNVTVSTNSVFIITCSKSGYSNVSDSVTVNITVAGAPTVDIKATPPGGTPSDGPITVTSGASVTLAWTTTNSPTSCSASGAWSGAKATGGGSQVVVVSVNSTFTISCSNANGSAADSVVVNVGGGGACDETLIGVNQAVGCLYNNTTLTAPPAAVAPPGTVLLAPVPDTATELDLNWGAGGPPGVGVDNFSARWQGTFTFNQGTYTFFAGADDGVRFYVDGNLLVDKWIPQGFTEYSANQVFGSAGTHTLKLEYNELGGSAQVRLRWTFAAAPLDLKARYVKPFSDQTFNAGDTATATVRVSNIGGTASPATTLGLWPTGSPTPNCPGTPQTPPSGQSYAVTPLAVGASVDIPVSFVVSLSRGHFVADVYVIPSCNPTDAWWGNNRASDGADQGGEVDICPPAYPAGNCSSGGFSYTVDVNAWFETTDGDVGSQGGVTISQLAPSIPAKFNSTYLLAAGGNLDDKAKSQNNWTISNYSGHRLVPTGSVYNYLADRFRSKATGSDRCNIPAGLPPGNNFYQCTGDAVFHVGKGPNGNNVFFIDGNLVVDGNLTLASADTSIFIVKGNITINTNVTQIDGIYVAGGRFSDTDPATESDDQGGQLVVNGAVYANSVLLSRYLGGASCGAFCDNTLYAANVINFQSKYLVALNSIIGSPSISWNEVAP